MPLPTVNEPLVSWNTPVSASSRDASVGDHSRLTFPVSLAAKPEFAETPPVNLSMAGLSAGEVITPPLYVVVPQAGPL